MCRRQCSVVVRVSSLPNLNPKLFGIFLRLGVMTPGLKRIGAAKGLAPMHGCKTPVKVYFFGYLTCESNYETHFV